MPPRSDKSTSVNQFDRFIEDFKAAVTDHDLARVFNRDTKHAYQVLTRDQEMGPEPTNGIGRAWRALRLFIKGLSSKLSPPRRALFFAALIFALLGMTNVEASSQSGVRISLSPLWFTLSVATLILLLALELVDRVLVRDELEVARQLQRDILPQSIPNIPDYSFAHASRTANEVGGDYYDLWTLPDGRLVIVMGDASGHGMAAGLLMAIAAAVLRLATDLDPQPDKVARILNQALCRTGDRRAFMSLFFAILHPQTGHLDYIVAGHPFPLLRRVGGAVFELGEGSYPLGIRDDCAPQTCHTNLDPGDVLAIYSDGLPEAYNHQQEALGYERVREVILHNDDPTSIVARLQNLLDGHRRQEPLHDDLSLLVVKRT